MFRTASHLAKRDCRTLPRAVRHWLGGGAIGLALLGCSTTSEPELSYLGDRELTDYKAMATLFKARKADDAVKIADDSAAAATATAAAAKAGDWDKVKSSWGTVNGGCKGCHDKHREKLEDGSYKIK